MKKMVLAALTLSASWAAIHYGYKAVTGRCPCEIRKALQLKLALLLVRGLEAEGYIELEEWEAGTPEDIGDFGFHLDRGGD